MLANKLTSGPNMPVKFYLFTRPDKQGDHPINVSISLFEERLCTSVGYTQITFMYSNATGAMKISGYLNALKLTLEEPLIFCIFACYSRNTSYVQSN